MRELFFLSVISLFIISPLAGQQYGTVSNPSYKFVSNPGFVNTTELNGATGIWDSNVSNSRYYFGITNIFGYQIDKNFSGGLGVGILVFDKRQLFPLYLDYRYNFYLKGASPYFFTDGGILLDPVDFLDESKLFLNPGIGISRYYLPKLELIISAGLIVQTRTSLRQVSFINLKLGIVFRKNAFRMFKQGRSGY